MPKPCSRCDGQRNGGMLRGTSGSPTGVDLGYHLRQPFFTFVQDLAHEDKVVQAGDLHHHLFSSAHCSRVVIPFA